MMLAPSLSSRAGAALSSAALRRLGTLLGRDGVPKVTVHDVRGEVAEPGLRRRLHRSHRRAPVGLLRVGGPVAAHAAAPSVCGRMRSFPRARCTTFAIGVHARAK